MKKSKTETLETRHLILTKAAQLFQARGLEATSIADVMAEANLTPGGFYRHFTSRDELIVEANGLAFEALISAILKRIEGRSPLKALKLIISTYLHQQSDLERMYLCPLSSNISQLDRCSPGVRSQAVAGFDALSHLIAEQMSRIGIQRPAVLADSVVATMVGAVALSRLDLKQANKILNNAQNTIDLLIESALPKTAK